MVRLRRGLSACLVAACITAGPLSAQSRSASLVVSVVVVPRCSIDAGRVGNRTGDGGLVALRCTGHAALRLRAQLAEAPLQPRVEVTDANRVNVFVPPSDSPDQLLTIDF